MIISGKDYPVIGTVKSTVLGNVSVPVLDIHMMSDEKWVEMTNTPEQIERRRKMSLLEAGDLNG